MINKNYIDGSIKPKDVSIFYEDGMPYLKYTGTAKTSNGIFVRVDIPKLDLELKDVLVKDEVKYCENKYMHVPISCKRECHIKDNLLINITPLERTCSKEDLEKELGYKLNIV